MVMILFRMRMKILCWFRGHKWVEFYFTPDVIEGKQCKRCGRVEHKNEV